MIEIVIEGQACAKERPRLGRRGRVYTPPRTRAYAARIAAAGRRAMIGRAPLTGPVRIEVVWRRAAPTSWSKARRLAALQGLERPTKRPDADNIIKAVADALNGIAWIDDAQIVEIDFRSIYAESDSEGLTLRIFALCV